MEGVVEAQAADGARVLGGQGREEVADLTNLVRNLVGAEDVTRDEAGLLGFGDVRHAIRKDGVAVVDARIGADEADEALAISLLVYVKYMKWAGESTITNQGLPRIEASFERRSVVMVSFRGDDAIRDSGWSNYYPR